ncbi:MAG: replicative DNA helicase [Bacteroidia bacterium]|jgi:replicative DNA helicase|tara:strand:- start:610 stop:2100 length:1491 start_codon:yes stop_codon:yes gene_type:complete
MEKKRATAKKKSTFGNMDMSKLQPQARDLEEAVLGALMLEKYAPEKVASYLKAEAFYVDAHQLIYGAVISLFTLGHPVDILTVTEQLRKDGTLESAGGAYYITSLTNKISSAANIEYHAHIVIQKSIQRQLITVAGEIGEKAFEETSDAFELLDQSEKQLFEIKNSTMTKNYDEVSDLIAKAIKDIEESTADGEGLTGIPTGFTELDRMTSGWQKSDLIILAARPGMGKTAFVLSMARNAAVLANKSVAIFSLEMSSMQLVKRLIASEAELSSEKIRSGKLEEHEWQQLHTKISTIEDAKLFIDDTPALSVLELKAKARRLKSNRQLDMIIIDYLQLMRAEEGNKNAGNREQEISYISRSLKGLAKELDIPIIALAQLSRAVEQRQDKRPVLSDLRESGSIEQDADLVTFIFRPEYYGITQDEEGNDNTGLTEIIIRKHRNGSPGTVNLKFVKHFGKFTDWGYSDYGDDTIQDSSVTFGSKMNDMSPFEPGEDMPF